MAKTEQAIALIQEIAELLKLTGENPFKVRAFEKAVDVLANESDLEARTRAGTLTDLPGIGKGISEVLTEFFIKGTTTARDQLKAAVPEGLLELVKVPGIGPKKALLLIEELGIKSISELEYACKENRLVNLKGFGEKAQKSILQQISFLKSTEGQARLSDVEAPATEILQRLKKAVGDALRVEESGQLRRRCEVLDRLDFLVELPSQQPKKAQEKIEKVLSAVQEEKLTPLKVAVTYADKEKFISKWIETTGSAQHLKEIAGDLNSAYDTENDFYEKKSIAWIPPEARETGEEVKEFKKKGFKELIQESDIRGVFHIHTTRSDGAASLEEMVKRAQSLGYEYIGISDHSQSAAYAQGLKKDTLKEQKKEIAQVQKKYPNIRIFWGIESDILKDGSLDYDKATLKEFDFVIASIHQRYGMDGEAMTQRIIEAIRNPYTRFIGHLSGRLLLGRQPYNIDIEKISKEAAEHDVALELNASPSRLDIDWRWGKNLRAHGTLSSVNPDAHDLAGLQDVRYGVWMARKALFTSDMIINSWPEKKVEQWLHRN